MKDILIPKEVSRYLKLPEKTVFKMAKTGKIPCIKFGRTYRFRLKTIEKISKNIHKILC